jgi:hypothetical protein
MRIFDLLPRGSGRTIRRSALIIDVCSVRVNAAASAKNTEPTFPALRTL